MHTAMALQCEVWWDVAVSLWVREGGREGGRE